MHVLYDIINTTIILNYFCPIVPALVQLDVNKTDVTVNGNVSGSCTMSGNPPPSPKVITPYHCNQPLLTKHTVTDNFTTRVEFEITNVSRDCCDIYCFATNHPISSGDKKTLNIINGNVNLYTNQTKNSINSYTDDDDAESEHTSDGTLPVESTTTTDKPINATTEGAGSHTTQTPASVAKRNTMGMFVLCVTLAVILATLN